MDQSHKVRNQEEKTLQQNQQPVAEVVAASPEQVASYRGGKAAALGWFVGQVMKATGGKANPAAVNEILKAKLGLG